MTVSRISLFPNRQDNHFTLSPRDFKQEWSVTVAKLGENQDITSKVASDIILKPSSFQRQRHVTPYLDKMVYDKSISFSCDEANYLHHRITDKNVSVTFSDTLHDIFAFDRHTYSGVRNYAASYVFPLTRLIHYLYIYSSISDYVHFGNTEALLLAVIPLAKEKCNLLKEKAFKTPAYVPVIYDHTFPD